MKKAFAGVFLGIYFISAVFFYDTMPAEFRTNGLIHKTFDIGAADLGVFCISNAYPAAEIEMSDSRDNQAQSERPENSDKDGDSIKLVASKNEEDNTPVVFGDEPAVLIVHTHATESYVPATEGNYHRKGQLNTVRDVGDVLAEALNKEGIASVHDKTLHDNPSYSQSYSRSYDTIKSLLKKYPDIVCVIDLHRDAISSKGSAAAVSIGGNKCAKYSYVVSTAVDTYESNLKFIKKLNNTASEDFDGFTGNVLERGYRYNQDLSSKYLLLEIGYNRNDIEEARNTAGVFAKILAETLKEGD